MMASEQLLFFFSALGAFNGILLSVYFAVNANKKVFTNYYLSFLLLVLSIRIMKSVFFYFNPQLANIFIQIGLSACVLIGPFLFLYLKTYSENKKQNWQIHVIPYVTILSVVGFFYPYVEHRLIWSQWIISVICLQWFIYLVFSIKSLQSIFKKIKTKQSLLKIDVWVLSIYFGVALIWLAYTTSAYTSYIAGALSFTFILYIVVLLLIFRKSDEVGFSEEKEKYKNKIDESMLATIDKKLKIIIEKELFLNPNFTLEEAAKELKLGKHLLSQYLNENLGKSFSTLIKEHRVDKAKQLLETEKNFTIESLGYESGFNSKSTFFTAFKKITGVTPAEYQKAYSK